jgi:hypothetical protein
VIVVDNALIVEKEYDRYLSEPFLDDGYLGDYDWYQYRPRFPEKSDRQIKADIENELFWSPFVDDDNVKVTVEDGKATLTGTVGSWPEYGAAQDNAYEGGAVSVDNDLVVTSPRA